MVNLKQIELATNEDRASGIDYWARLFTAVSWEELKMIAQDNPFLTAASQAMYEYNADDVTRQKCLAREDYYRRERYFQQIEEKYEKAKQQLADTETSLAEKEAVLANKNAEITELRRQLAEAVKQ